MKPIICEVCGANEFIKDNGVYKCKYCNTEYTLEEFKKLMIEGPVELVKGKAEKERLVKNAIQYVQLKEYELAETEYKNIVHQFPEDCRGWLGLFSIEFHKYLNGDSFSYPNLKNLENALNLSEDNKEIFDFFDSFMLRYGDTLHTATYAYNAIDWNFNTIKPYTIDDFTKWMLYDALDDLFKVNYEKLTLYLTDLSEKYYSAMMEGNLAPCAWKLPNCIKDEDWSLWYSAKDQLIINLFKYLGYKIRSDKYYFEIISKNTKKSVNLSYNRSDNFGIIGNWLYVGLTGGHYLILLPNRISKSLIWQLCGWCRYCGHKFNGLLNKVCSNPNCNMPKDY